MAKVRWHINKLQESDGSIVIEHVAITDNKAVIIATLEDGTKEMQKQVRANLHGYEYWAEDGIEWFDRVRDAKAEAEKWLRA